MKIFRTSVVAAGVVMLGLASAEVGAASYQVVDDGVPASLTGNSGDAAKGKETAANRKQGNCLACHAISDLASMSFHGEVGPSLDGVADRYSEAQLRLILIDSKKIFEGTIMPAFYRTEGYTRPLKKFEGKSILSAEQVEDVIAYLQTLKEQ